MNRLKELRGELTQTFVADRIGISQRTYSNYESGTRQPDHDTLIKIAEYFNVSVDYLLGRDTIVNENGIDYTIPAGLDPRLIEGLEKHGITLADLAKLTDEQVALIVSVTQNLIDKKK